MGSGWGARCEAQPPVAAGGRCFGVSLHCGELLGRLRAACRGEASSWRAPTGTCWGCFFLVLHFFSGEYSLCE